MTDVFPDLRADLVRAAAADARRRSLRGRGARISVVAAAAAAATMLLVGWPNERVDIVTRAGAAITAGSGEIIHTVVIRTAQVEGSRRRPTTDTVEQWEASNPTRGRIWVRPSLDPVGGGQTSYGEERGVVMGFERHTPTRSLVLGLSEADPTAAVKRLLADGALRDVGDTVVNGRTVRRLQGHIAMPYAAQDLRVDLDPDTAAPIRMQSRVTPTIAPVIDGVPQRAETLTVTAQFVRIEKLPLNADTARLLKAPARGTRAR